VSGIRDELVKQKKLEPVEKVTSKDGAERSVTNKRKSEEIATVAISSDGDETDNTPSLPLIDDDEADDSDAGNDITDPATRKVAAATPEVAPPPSSEPSGQTHAQDSAVLQAELWENTDREPLTPTEAVELGRRIEELERPAAKERKESNLNKGTESPKGKISTSGNTGKTRDKVGESVGMSGKTYEKGGISRPRIGGGRRS
jgi:hypothetical protein